MSTRYPFALHSIFNIESLKEGKDKCNSKIVFSVALNYQTEDIPNFINTAKFLDNGECGYVLKPKFLCDPSIDFDPTKISPKLGMKVKVHVRVISGQLLPKIPGSDAIVNPYVQVKVFAIKMAFVTETSYFFNHWWHADKQTNPNVFYAYILNQPFYFLSDLWGTARLSKRENKCRFSKWIQSTMEQVI